LVLVVAPTIPLNRTSARVNHSNSTAADPRDLAAAKDWIDGRPLN